MRIHGWCERCKKIKPVTVTTAGMVAAATQGVVVGVCLDCEEKK